MYINPIPMIDAGKAFEMRLSVSFDDVTELEEAKRNTARYLLEQNEETLASWLHCTDIRPVYPEDIHVTRSWSTTKKCVWTEGHVIQNRYTVISRKNKEKPAVHQPAGFSNH